MGAVHCSAALLVSQMALLHVASRSNRLIFAFVTPFISYFRKKLLLLLLLLLIAMLLFAASSYPEPRSPLASRGGIQSEVIIHAAQRSNMAVPAEEWSHMTEGIASIIFALTTLKSFIYKLYTKIVCMW